MQLLPTFKVIASTSEGNAYVMNAGESLLIEAGASMAQIMHAIDYHVRNVEGCIITHEHGDHAGHINEVLSYGIPVWATIGTINALVNRINPRYIEAGLVHPIESQPGENGERIYKPFNLGRYQITAFPTKHDAAEPVGFYIEHESIGATLFATDTYYLPCTFANLSHVVIECNYLPALLERNALNGVNGMNSARAERVKASHLSLDTCLEALQANDLTAVQDITLIHLSYTNGNAATFKHAVEQATGIPTYIAKPGLCLPFTPSPF